MDSSCQNDFCTIGYEINAASTLTYEDFLMYENVARLDGDEEIHYLA